MARPPSCPPRLRFPVALASLVSLCAGCWSATGGADEEDNQAQSGALQAASAPQALAADLVSPAGTPVGALSATTEELVQSPATPGTGAAPNVFFLEYADGTALSRGSPNPCPATPPKFVCDFAPTLAECQRQIQVYLDKWFAEFNIVFTLTRPTAGSYYTEVISSGGGAWCNAATNVAGIAPFLCDDLQGGVAYTFLGGKTAKETAIIIAQEQAHLVGLEHTLSTHDVMDPTICPDCDGFEDVDNKIQSDHCNRALQNSYEMMKQRLGTWTGGTKTTPFGCTPDTDTPAVQILAPGDGDSVADSFVLQVQASDACKVSRVTVAVAPLGLHAQSSSPPFEWTLTKISGKQTITVTAFDPSGKQSSAVITVHAGKAVAGTGGAAAKGDAGGTGGVGGMDGGTAMAPAEVSRSAAAGCQVGGCGMTDAAGGGRVGWASLIAALAAAFILSLRPRRTLARSPTSARPRSPRPGRHNSPR